MRKGNLDRLTHGSENGLECVEDMLLHLMLNADKYGRACEKSSCDADVEGRQ